MAHVHVGVGQQAAQGLEGRLRQLLARAAGRREAQRELGLAALDAQRLHPVLVDDAAAGAGVDHLAVQGLQHLGQLLGATGQLGLMQIKPAWMPVKPRRGG